MGASISYKYMNSYSSLQNYRVMTVNIDENSDDPFECCTYADDALGMPVGFSGDAIIAWKEFFKYRPCILCGNEVLEYLDPDNYDLREDGNPSLLSGRTHNTVNGSLGVRTYEDHWLWNSEKQKMMRVMIEWPRLGIKISRQQNVVSISMTDQPNAPGYSYQAYYLNGISYEHLYIETNFCHLTNDGYPGDTTDDLYFADPTESPLSDWWNLSDRCTTKATLLNNLRRTQVGTTHYHLTNYHQLNIIQCACVLHSKSIDRINKIGLPENRELGSPNLTNGSFGYYISSGNFGHGIYSMTFGLYNMWYSPPVRKSLLMVYDGLCCTDIGLFYVMQDGNETSRWGSVDNYQPITSLGDFSGGVIKNNHAVKSIITDNGTLLPSSTYNTDDTYYSYWGWYGMFPDAFPKLYVSDPELDGTDDVVLCGQPMITDSEFECGGIFSAGSAMYSWCDGVFFRVSVLL